VRGPQEGYVVGFIRVVDKLSLWVGHCFSWCIMILVLGVSYEVFVRYVLHAPTVWAFDISYIMYGALFMMCGAYTLSVDGHVRADMIFRKLPFRGQAGLELVLYFLFFFPGVIALVYVGTIFASRGWRYLEVSVNSPANIPIYPLKSLIPIAGAFLLLQGIAEVMRCIICLRDGRWPRRLHDVEEIESAVVHVHEDKTRIAGERTVP
jgi:TRAP-type mannitol/chloroaromatic compound transport system permease small subunit